MTTSAGWRKSSRSQNGQDCVEVHRSLAGLRDSKNAAGSILHADTAALIRAVRAGGLDRAE